MPTRGDDDPNRNLPHKSWDRPPAASNEWIKEMRRRTHDLAESFGIMQGTCVGLRNDLTRLDDAMKELRQQIESIASADDIAAAVRADHRTIGNLVVKVLSAGAALFVVLASAKSLFGF